MFRSFIRNNITLASITLFLIIFIVVIMLKPGFLYNKDGSLREFGVGYKNKTILPVWLFSIILGILCYVLVLYYLTYPRYF
jgi:Ca2+/H+ antiporter